jgi:magnesium transporter
MLTTRIYRQGALERSDAGLDELPAVLRREGTMCWVDVEHPDEEVLSTIREVFGLHPLAVEDTSHWGQRSKIEVFDEHSFLVLHALWPSKSSREAAPPGPAPMRTEIHAFASARFLVTFRSNANFDMSRVTRRWDERPELLAEGGGALLYGLLDEVVDGYLDLVDEHEDAADRIEGAVFESDGDPSVQRRIFDVRRRVIAFRRAVAPLRQVVDVLQELPGFVSPRMYPYYRDVADHVLRTLDFIDTVRELLTAALEAQLAQVSNRLSVDTKKISAWGAILLVPTLIAGIYGMNFDRMPELDWRFGYPVALGVMAVSAGLLYWSFKRREWL